MTNEKLVELKKVVDPMRGRTVGEDVAKLISEVLRRLIACVLDLIFWIALMAC